jgi:hypothetical protein
MDTQRVECENATSLEEKVINIMILRISMVETIFYFDQLREKWRKVHCYISQTIHLCFTIAKVVKILVLRRSMKPY